MHSNIRGPDIAVVKFNLATILGRPELTMPASYLVLDTETTGVSIGASRVWQIGVYPVIKGVPRYPFGRSFWLQTDVTDLKKADFEINRRAELARPKDCKTGNIRHIVKDAWYNRCEQEFIAEVEAKGKNRQQVLSTVQNVLISFQASGWPIVGQNCVRFDIPMMEWEWLRAGLKYEFQPSNILDVGILFKAGVLGRRILMRETPGAFFHSVAETVAKGVFFSLERALVPYYNLDTKYKLDMSQTHDAGFDCWLTAMALEAMLADCRKAAT